MIDDNGEELSDENLLKTAMEHLSDACCFLFEIETDQGRAAAMMADNALKYCKAILDDRDPRLSGEFTEKE